MDVDAYVSLWTPEEPIGTSMGQKRWRVDSGVDMKQSLVRGT